ncbi:MAG: peptidoglycan-binding protein [Alphaproteobacteria bacterium]|nr:peptidoglycan-binding protein [Alphaproteobacteria bacterium]
MFITDIIGRGLISRSVGNNLENEERDVLAVKDGLSHAGFFSFDDNPAEPHGIITREMDDGIKSFQKSKGLKIDGRLFPKGETEGALVQEMRGSTGFKGRNTEVILPESQEVLKQEKKPNPEPKRRHHEPHEKFRICKKLRIRLANEQLSLESLHKKLTGLLQEEQTALDRWKEAYENYRKVSYEATFNTTIGLVGKGASSLFTGLPTMLYEQNKVEDAKKKRDLAKEHYEGMKLSIQYTQQSMRDKVKKIDKLEQEIRESGC